MRNGRTTWIGFSRMGRSCCGTRRWTRAGRSEGSSRRYGSLVVQAKSDRPGGPADHPFRLCGCVCTVLLSESGVDAREDRRDAATEQGQDTDNDDGDQHQDQGVLDQALAFLTSEEIAKHGSDLQTECNVREQRMSEHYTSST